MLSMIQYGGNLILETPFRARLKTLTFYQSSRTDAKQMVKVFHPLELDFCSEHTHTHTSSCISRYKYNDLDLVAHQISIAMGFFRSDPMPFPQITKREKS